MNTISATDIKRGLSSILEQIETGPVIIIRHSRPVAVIISYEDWERMNLPARGKVLPPDGEKVMLE